MHPPPHARAAHVPLAALVLASGIALASCGGRTPSDAPAALTEQPAPTEGANAEHPSAADADEAGDHPFLFLLLERRSGAVLFVGRVSDPR